MPDHIDALQAQLPAGLLARPCRPADAGIVTALVAACERHDDGEVEIDEADIVAAWSRPSVDLSQTSVAVFDRDALVAGGEVAGTRAEIDVHPDRRGQGIGSALMRWTWGRAKAAGQTIVGQTISDSRTDAARMFAVHGYAPRWESWLLRMEMPERPARRALPDGYVVRDYVPGADDLAVHELIEAAFNEWPNREPLTLHDWRALTVASASFAADASPVLMAGDRVAGVAINFDYGAGREGWTQQLAVDARDRGKGLGQALLTESWRRFWDAGRRECGLSTDSRTGALGLYLRAGMRVRRSYTNWAKTLDG